MKRLKVSVLLGKTVRKQVFPNGLAELKSFAEVRQTNAARLTPESAKRLIRGADAAISGWGTPTLTKQILDEAPDLRMVAHSAGTVKWLTGDPEFWRRRIIVTTCAPYIGISVAEYSLGLVITGLAQVMRLSRLAPQFWGIDDRMLAAVPSRGLLGQTIGVVSAGFVGRHMIALLRDLDAEILLYDPYVSAGQARRLGAKKCSLAKMARTCDAVTLHAPKIPETYHMIGESFLANMRPHAVLVNTARGAVLDEKALAKVFRKRKDLFAFLDVTDPEPPAKTSPLRRMDNVALTPHVAGYGSHSRLGAGAVVEVRRFAEGLKPLHRVTEKMLSRMA